MSGVQVRLSFQIVQRVTFATVVERSDDNMQQLENIYAACDKLAAAMDATVVPGSVRIEQEGS